MGSSEATEERHRIARDLHDVLGHNLSVISLQAAVAIRAMERDDSPAIDALRAIKAMSDATLTGLRSVLGVLRSVDRDRAGSLATSAPRLEALATSAALLGVTARIREHSAPAHLPPSIEKAAYHIVQEALTNVARHSGASSADVEILYGLGGIRLEVEDQGSGSGDWSSGLGILGMTERAVAVGGWLRAGPHPDGGFHVTAWLPLAGPGHQFDHTG